MISEAIVLENIQELLPEAQIPPEAQDLEQTVFEKLSSFIKNVIDFDTNYAEMSAPQEDKEEVLRTFFSLVYTLKTLQLHFTFVQKVLKTESEAEVLILKQEFKTIAKLYTKINKKDDLSLYPLDQALDTVVKAIFADLEAITKNFYSGKNYIKKVKKSTENLFKVKIITAKIETMIEYFPGLVSLSKDDLFAQARDSPIWQSLYKDVRFECFAEKGKVMSSLSTFLTMVTVSYAVVHKTEEAQKQTKSKALGKAMGVLSGAYYLAKGEKAKTRASLLYAQPSMELAFKVWNIPENKLVKKLMKFIAPNIKYDKKIYIPRLFTKITKESILKEHREGTLNQMFDGLFEVPDLSGQREEILKTLFVENKERIQVRILAPWPLVISNKSSNKVNVAAAHAEDVSSYMNVSVCKLVENFNGVVIHVHGGGFVAMSSSSHRSYLIRWAKALNMIVFSIDYRLAPKDPYPAGLDDVWQAYNWIVNYSESILNIPIDRVVLAGDSAGGNLIAALTLRAIKEGARVPDGCLMSYPALNLYPQKVVPSYFVALEDMILPYSLLKLCLKAYVPEDCHAESDPFLSPIVASDELLSKMPAVRIITGTNDPLHDDNWKFLSRLQNLNKDVKMTVFDGVPHGFLSLDDMESYEMVIAESVGRIRELFYSVEEKDDSALHIKKLDKRVTSSGV